MKEEILKKNIQEKKQEDKIVVKKVVSLKKCTYQRNFGLTQCGSAI